MPQHHITLSLPIIKLSQRYPLAQLSQCHSLAQCSQCITLDCTLDSLLDSLPDSLLDSQASFLATPFLAKCYQPPAFKLPGQASELLSLHRGCNSSL